MIATKDRHSELALCLQSLRTQQYQDWDVVIGDESGTPIQNCQFLQSIIFRLRFEGHGVEIIRNDKSQGVCYIRNLLIEKNPFDNPLQARFDDDVILESDYLSKMMMIIGRGYDLASGVTPLVAQPEWKRELSYVGKIINDMELDNEGNVKTYKDDCGYSYSALYFTCLPTTNFRSNAVYRTKLIKEGIRYPIHLSKIGFREEAWFSLKAILKGFKLAVDVTAKAYHLQCSSGGCRADNYAECVKIDEEAFRKWVKEQFQEKGDFIAKYKESVLNAN